MLPDGEMSQVCLTKLSILYIITFYRIPSRILDSLLVTLQFDTFYIIQRKIYYINYSQYVISLI